jgi:hypothetical protein
VAALLLRDAAKQLRLCRVRPLLGPRSEEGGEVEHSFDASLMAHNGAWQRRASKDCGYWRSKAAVRRRSQS